MNSHINKNSLRQLLFLLFAFCSLVVSVVLVKLAEASSELIPIPVDQLADRGSRGEKASNLGNLNLNFIPNQGQYPESIAFSTFTSKQTVFFNSAEILFLLNKPSINKTSGESSSKIAVEQIGKRSSDRNRMIRMKFLNSNQYSKIRGEEEKSGKMNFLRGSDPSRWKTDVATFGKIVYESLYIGIDLVFYGNEEKIQHDFIISPKGDAGNIRFSVDGVQKVEKTRDGELVVKNSTDELRFSRPFLYQFDEGGNKTQIDGEFQLFKDKSVGFRVGKYDRSKTLVIDPILSYSSFLGGTFDDIGNGIDVDIQGNIYITGSTSSVDFPVSQGGIGSFPEFKNDVFITKLNPQGTQLIYSTIIGSKLADDVGYDVKVNASGQAYIVGVAGGGDFPRLNPLSYDSSIFSSNTVPINWQNSSGISGTIYNIVADPNNSGVAFACTRSGIYKTSDSGANWILSNSGFGRDMVSATTLAINRVNSNILISAGTSPRSQYQVNRSVDGGQTWTSIPQSFGNPVRFTSIVFDPTTTNKVYMSNGDNIFKSTNQGVSWNRSDTGINTEYIYKIVVNPNSPNILYGATANGIFKSVNEGQNWAPLPGGWLSFNLVINPIDPNIMLSVGLGSVYKTNNGGQTWNEISNQTYPNAATQSLFYSPNDPAVLYASIRYLGVFKSVDGGITWNTFNEGLPSLEINSIALSANGNKLFTGLQKPSVGGGFALKINAQGSGFVYSTLFGGTNNALAIDSSGKAFVVGYIEANSLPLVNPLRTFAGRKDGYVAVISSDGGGTFGFSSYVGGSEDDIAYDIALDANENIYLAGATMSSDFPTVNARQNTLQFQGDAFITKLSPMGSNFLYSTYLGGNSIDEALGIDIDQSGNLFVVGSTGSSNFPTGVTQGAQTVYGGGRDAFISKFDPSGSTMFYSSYLGGREAESATEVIATQNGAAYVSGFSKSVDFPTLRSLKSKCPLTKSSTRGSSWRNDLEGIAVNSVYGIAIDPQNSSNLLAATDKGVYKSSDNGENWIRSVGIPSASYLLTIEVVYAPSNPSIAFAGLTANGQGVGGGVYKSTDGGISWTQFSNNIPTSFQQIHALAVDPSNPNIVYAGSNGFNPGFPIYKSTNGGASWVNISNSMVFNVSDIKIDPTNSGIVYASNRNSVIARSDSGGSGWQTISSPSFSSVNSIGIDRSIPTRLYLGTQTGVFQSSNSGQSWQNCFTLLNANAFVTVDPVNPENIYAGTSSGFYFSNDRGTTWNLRTSGLIYPQVGAVEIDPLNNGVVYLATTPTVEYDAFVSKINPDGNEFEYASIFGGTASASVFPDDYAYDMARGLDGTVYVTGWTRIANFPTTPGSLSNHFGGNYEAFVSELFDSWKIKGIVTLNNGNPLDAVDLSLNGTENFSTTTQLDGKYKINQVRSNSNFVIIPRRSGFAFNPPSQSIGNISSDQTINFVATPTTRTLSGRVTDSGQNPLSDALISLSGSESQSTNTDSNGCYAISVGNGGSYEIKATKSNYIFAPSSFQIENLSSDQTVNFTASNGYYINGRVSFNATGISNIPISLVGSASLNANTNSDGYFSFQVPAAGNYTVSANSNYYVFAPQSFSLSNLSSNQDLPFVATLRQLQSNGKIAYSNFTVVDSKFNHEIFTLSANGDVNLSNNLADERTPVWSPNGRRIAFTSNRNQNWDIFVMNADGGDQRQLTTSSSNSTEPTWSADGDRILFVRVENSYSSSEIYSIKANGTDETRITNNPWFETSPECSPDGNEIVFVSEENGNSEIYLMKSDGTDRRRLTNNSEVDANPTWSHDGRKIAFDRGVGNSKEIYLMDRNGTNQTRLTQNSTEDKSPAFSPDGVKLAFINSGLNTCSTTTLYTLNIDGTQLTPLSSCSLASDPDWQNQPNVPSIFDFDGDGKTDISVFRPSVGEWYYQRSSNSVVNGAQFGSSTDKPAPADYTGDGKTDIAFFRPSTGEWFILRSEDSSYYAFPFGASTDIPTPGDFDGDGKADVAVFRPSNGVWYINKSSGGVTITSFGANGDRPVVADYDGDGKSDIAIFRPNVGEWYALRSTAGIIGAQFGASTDKTVQGDYTGDGKADFAFFRPSDGNWYVLRSEDFSYFASPFGASTDTPTPGDYDGDGKFDQAVFRPSNGVWYVNKSNGSGVIIQQFGTSTDLPVPSYYLP